MNRAIVIRKAGDAQIADAIAEGINAVELRNVRAEYTRLQARDGVRREGDDRRWKRTQRRLERKYAVRPVGKVRKALLVSWALIWYSVYTMGERLVEMSRR